MDTISSMNAQAEAFAYFLKVCGLLEERDGVIVDCHPYFNCRERGFVLTLRCGKAWRHFAWFEHRNSDELCAIEWTGDSAAKQRDFFTWQDIPTEIYPDKYSVTASFEHGQFGEAVAWLRTRTEAFNVAAAKINAETIAAVALTDR